jgi:hypothetical protein
MDFKCRFHNGSLSKLIDFRFSGHELLLYE